MFPKSVSNAKELLNYYGLGSTYNTRVKYGNMFHIKHEVAICIARADSHLGKALKSRYNLGNVGNTDRGNVVHFNSIESGIKAIFLALNNKWLSTNNTIGELSEGGRIALGLPSCKNRGVFCYATSKSNWNNNVLNCLSHIYKTEKTEKFKFRK